MSWKKQDENWKSSGSLAHRDKYLETERSSRPVYLGGGGGSRNTGMCHYFGYFFGVAPGFLGTFLGYSRIFGYNFFGYSQIFGYHFLVKFDFFWNNPDFGLLILVFRSMTLWNVACRALVSMVLQFSLLFDYVCAKSSMLSITAISLSSYTCSGF